ncbi:condensation domain-containing protein, partial [Ruminococcus flavefaciens]|uniref:condensation domain-containing protein n=1 Tax=Ruminococcus flavefaciens TaxID=1265 RepID=UPI001FA77B5C
MKNSKVVNNNIEDVFPLSPLQEGMLFHNIINGCSSAYVVQTAFAIETVLQEEYLCEALKLLLKKYSVLRTNFFYEKIEKPRQIVLRDKEPDISFLNWSDSCETKVKKDFAELLHKDVERGFDLRKDSLIRVKYVKLNDKSKLVFTLHHIIIDGWCTSVLFEKFLYYYARLEKGELFESILQEINAEKNNSHNYSEYIKWLQRQDQTKALEYWENELEGYDSDADIKAMSEPEPTEDQMRELEGETDADTTEKIRKITEKNEATINVAAEIAVGILLQKYSGSKDVVFGKVVSGRNAPINGIEDMVGLFVNTIPVRVIIDEKTTVSELIKTQQEKGTESTNYDYCSLADIQSKTAQGSELIKVLYVFENYASGAVKDAENADSTIKVESAREQTNYGITISGFIKNGRLSFKIMYDPNKYCDNEIRLIMDRLLKICREMAENPNG